MINIFQTYNSTVDAIESPGSNMAVLAQTKLIISKSHWNLWNQLVMTNISRIMSDLCDWDYGGYIVELLDQAL